MHSHPRGFLQPSGGDLAYARAILKANPDRRAPASPASCADGTRAYLEDGFTNDVTSDGTPYYATARLNAVKQFVAMALLHHGSPHPRWGGMLTRIGHRNLVQLRLEPDFTLPGIETALSGSDRRRLFCDEPVWLPQEPPDATDGQLCSDCGGQGDLRAPEGTFADTRKVGR